VGCGNWNRSRASPISYFISFWYPAEWTCSWYDQPNHRMHRSCSDSLEAEAIRAWRQSEDMSRRADPYQRN
jgi:hypothetical protein